VSPKSGGRRAPVVPTEEIVVLGASASPWRLLLVVAISLLGSYTIVFASGYTGQHRRHAQSGVVQGPWSETLASYLVALGVAAALLLLFGRFDLASVREPLAEVVIAGLPASIGGAAGRLAV